MGRGLPRDKPRYGATTNRIIDLYGVADDGGRIESLMCAEEGFRKENVYGRYAQEPGSGTREESPGEEAAAK